MADKPTDEADPQFARPACSATEGQYEYKHLTKEIIDLLPDKPPSIGEFILGKSKLARRVAQLTHCYGSIVEGAIREAYLHRYKSQNINTRAVKIMKPKQLLEILKSDAEHGRLDEPMLTARGQQVHPRDILDLCDYVKQLEANARQAI